MIRTLRAKLHSSWGADTANVAAEWQAGNPSKGQCAVTALIVDDEFGLPLVRGYANLPDGTQESHYWNELLDLTFGQFPCGTTFQRREDGPQGEDARVRIMGDEALSKRYHILRDRVGKGGFEPAAPLTYLYQINDPEEAIDMGFGCMFAVVEENLFKKTGLLKDEHILDDIIDQTGLTELDPYLEEIAESMFASDLTPDALKLHLNMSGFFKETALF
jgi:hypothetical protein